MLKKTGLITGIIVVVLLAALVVDVPAVAKFLGFKDGLTIHKGLDLQGGTHLVYQTDLSKNTGSADDAVTGVVNVIRRRVDSLGVSEPVIQKTRDNSRVIVELPGISDVNQAINLIGTTAQLEFREGIAEKSLDDTGSVKSENYQDWQDIGLTGADFVAAEAQVAQANNSIVRQPQVAIEFNSRGAKIFAEATKKNLQKPLAIFLDQKLLSAPTVQTEISDGKAVISGGFTLAEAKSLAIQLKAGALPVPVKLISQNNIGATLGQEAVTKSVVAGLLGLLMVLLFMLVYYRLPGLVAAGALVIYALVALAVYIAIPVTLTLAGIAGFIISIGMAIDANILIFERMKEELREGKTIVAAIDAGFSRAWSSIRDSNISTIITCIILYYSGSGLIRGFAVTLGVGVVISLFSAITVSHTLLQLVAITGLSRYFRLWGAREIK
ncbi:protein-export membrane protein SecD [candidate division Kazan bacterium RIFCSPHIGHO2_01_FULL_49_10]|uniref:Protein translocase subunit SecD n=1 Tax=candidate division Kazan bacterium RIFCSPLOWO2_01_FULL_48_13 TaxID=1798539 RepID=A0A1F4PNT9_UNCK3|nr:MAG: protein-export membrane protein SecD [candidate division Kazan bacterium RIFCSPHIGHO2_01_FULL_49_10]OGB85351.1 MAG: protein-export membrane protein SecD [candidate division Kazan bacterium RIFCSPLOWO2_01_FULL_48_13]